MVSQKVGGRFKPEEYLNIWGWMNDLELFDYAGFSDCHRDARMH